MALIAPSKIRGTTDGDRRTVQSVDRACAILRFLGERQGEDVSLGAVARYLTVHKSTALRLLASMERAGLVERDQATGRYFLGLEVVAMTGSVLCRLPILRIADPQLRRLSEATQQTVNLAVRYRHEILNIDQIAGPNIIRSIDWLGKRAPLHSGAAAKALLAHLEDAEIETYLNGADAAGTDLEPTQFWGEIEKIRTQGFAINRGELDPLIFAVGAPIFDAERACCASVSIAWNHQTILDKRIDEFASLAVRTAFTISRQLGYQDRRVAQMA